LFLASRLVRVLVLVNRGMGRASCSASMPRDLRLPHEKLMAYQEAVELLRRVREMRITDPRMRDQILRASKSVCLNIAEAVGRFSDADRKRVYAIARGECCEAAAGIDIARSAAECDLDRARAARETAGAVYALLTGLIRKYDSETGGPTTDHLHQPSNLHQTKNKDEPEPD
jgi:four helix bundle protein